MKENREGEPSSLKKMIEKSAIKIKTPPHMCLKIERRTMWVVRHTEVKRSKDY